MKKIISFLLVIASLLTLSITAGAENLTSADALAILRHVAGVAELSDEDLSRFDLNNNGRVDTADALFVLRFIAGLEEMPLPPLSKLPDDIEKKIREDFTLYMTDTYAEIDLIWEFTSRDVNVDEYLGSYNGYKAVIIGLTDGEWHGAIGIYLHKDSFVVDINTAYYQNLINIDDVIKIHHYFPRAHISLFTFSMGDIIPRKAPPPLTTSLSPQTEWTIIENYARFQRVPVDDTTIDKYLGTYNGFEAVTMSVYSGRGGGNGGVPQFYAAGFRFVGVANVFLHIDSSFICISEAYLQEIISENDVYSIHYYWSLRMAGR
ncbi:MAG: dockerin type I repeat-containing protein [Oscillospiraceae bacterium]|nr:dockerin type I repeat-containing protein [Oscillospiraceae bacterium]